MADRAPSEEGLLVHAAAGAHRLPQVLDHQRPEQEGQDAHCGDPEERRRGQEGCEALHHRCTYVSAYLAREPAAIHVLTCQRMSASLAAPT